MNDKLKILFAADLDVLAGGPTQSIRWTLAGLEHCATECEVVAPPPRPGGKFACDNIPVHRTEPPCRPRLFGYVPGMRNLLSGLGRYDLYFINGIWSYWGHAVAKYAKRQRKPYVVSLRGALYPQCWEKSFAAKKLAMFCFQRGDLQAAGCVHVTCEDELRHYRDLGFTNPVAVIPNPVECAREAVDQKRNYFTVGYLGRLHSRKRVERLIYAFAELQKDMPECRLLIIGADDPGYEKFLKDEVARLKLGQVEFTGFLSGKAKSEAMGRLSVLVVPSDFENFGNIVPEALTRGIPVITSKGLPWQALDKHCCGLWIENNSTELIFAALKDIASRPADELAGMGSRGRRLVEEKYSPEAVGRQMYELFCWMTIGGTAPDFLNLTGK